VKIAIASIHLSISVHCSIYLSIYHSVCLDCPVVVDQYIAKADMWYFFND